MGGKWAGIVVSFFHSHDLRGSIWRIDLLIVLMQLLDPDAEKAKQKSGACFSSSSA